MYNIVDSETDEADKTRVRVEINGQTVMFKFQDEPTYAEVQETAARYDAMMQEQADAPAQPE
jgi:hypothetical protein